MEDIKIVMLKNRQHVICKLSELRTETDEPLCFLFEVPFVVSYSVPSENAEEKDIQIKFAQWSPFSKSLQFRVPFEQVVSIGEPKDGILQKYIELLKPYYPIVNDAEPTTEIEETENE
jgi:hypothetical protein